MGRPIFLIVCGLIYLLVGLVIYTSWPSYVAFFAQRFSEDYAQPVAIVFTTILYCFLVLVQANLSDIFMSKHHEIKEQTLEERRLDAEKAAKDAVAKGDLHTALRLYERVGLVLSALQIAEQIRDRSALIRLYTKLGRHDRARRLMLEEGDMEGAAHASILLGEIDLSRTQFRKAAEKCNARENPKKAAELWNRAGELHRAAILYEEAGDWDKAAECFDLMGQREEAERCINHFKAMKAFELRTAGIQKPVNPEQQKADQLKSVAILKEHGDYFAAAEILREVPQWEEAAWLYEKLEEWERAARCFDAAGKTDRAMACRAKIVQRELLPPDHLSQSLVSLPHLEVKKTPSAENFGQQVIFAKPGAIPAGAFQPINQQAAVFVTMVGVQPPQEGSVSGSTGPSAFSGFGALSHMQMTMPGGGRLPYNPNLIAAQENLTRALRKGQVREAARLAKQAEDHLLSAALYEQVGDVLTAAEVYRQIGRYTEASQCLARHGDFLEAARLSIAVQQKTMAVRHLLRGMYEDPASSYALGLAEIALSMQAPAMARKIMLRHTATVDKQVPELAEGLYKFVALFEQLGYYQHALEALRILLGIGARNPLLIEKEALLAANVGESPKPDGIDPAPLLEKVRGFQTQETRKGSGSTTRPRNEAAEVHSTKGRNDIPADLTQLLHDQPTQLTSSAGYHPHQVVNTFHFEPPDKLGSRLIYPVPTEQSQKSASDQGVSLFGRPSTDSHNEEELFKPANRYELQNELGRGGMGVIYEAQDTVLGRPVALKFILRGENTTKEEFAQFLLEARAIAKISHTNIVTVYDIGVMRSKHYIAMELIKGSSLSQALKEKGPFPLSEALRVFIETAKGLHAAHEHGIVHRDIKPGNILFNDKRSTKIVDFGLAKLQAKHQINPSENLEKYRYSGTPGFMAPETIRGADPHPTVDVYALGVLFYFMLTGEPPHKSVSPLSINDILAFQLKGVMPKIRDRRPEVPEAFEHLYRYCTMANPSDRYQSIQQFLPDAEKYYKALN
jgi:tetratricopeptide (TPR) repeat protein/predicted Ser/Thr protein kinase